MKKFKGIRKESNLNAVKGYDRKWETKFTLNLRRLQMPMLRNLEDIMKPYNKTVKVSQLRE